MARKGSREVVRKGSREVVLKPAVTYKMSSILVCSKIIGQRSAQRHVLRDWRIVALEESGCGSGRGIKYQNQPDA